MYFCVFHTPSGEYHLGGTLDPRREAVVDLTADWPAGEIAPRDVAALAIGGDASLEVARSILSTGKCLLAVRDLVLAAPVPRPARNLFCVGRNYKKHIIEGNVARGAPPDTFPAHIEFFSKTPATVIGPDSAIPLHAAVTRQLDYEVELVIIIGRSGANYAPEAAERHVFGYTIVNDITARDLQRRHGQWFKGKSLDGSCPMGPWVAHRGSGIDPMDLGIRLMVNGELRQNDRTSEMLFSVAEIISQLSAGMALVPGDVIATGTPSGVGFAMQPPAFLREGDVISAEIDGLGVLRNSVGTVA